MRPILVAVAALCAACSANVSGGGDGGVDGGGGAPDGGVQDGGGDAGVDAGSWIPGPHQPYPQIPWHGGPVLSQPKLVTITYSADPNASLRNQLGDFLVTSAWFDAWRGDYNVGPAVHLAQVQLDGGPPAMLDENAVGSLILGEISAGTLPPPDAGVVYALYLPSGPNLTFGGSPVCENYNNVDFFGGYHWEAQGVPFALIPTCKSGTLTESESHVEFSASHEFAEACTDPFPSSNVAWELQDGSVWNVLGGEVGDVCNGMFGLESGWSLQRIWSNSAAAVGNDPCVQQLVAEPFYAASLSPSSTQVVPAGQSVTLMVQGWSMAAVPSWNLSLKVSAMGFAPTTQLGATTLNDSQTTTLTVTVPSTATSGSQAIVFLLSQRSTTDYMFWPELIKVQ